AFGRLLEASLGAGVLDDALAVDLLLEAAESLVDGLAFANLDFYGHVSVWRVERTRGEGVRQPRMLGYSQP
ncbi:MAG: hypothetical protein RL515_1110, partial [Verrucomicrobiota bacterium]